MDLDSHYEDQDIWHIEPHQVNFGELYNDTKEKIYLKIQYDDFWKKLFDKFGFEPHMMNVSSV